MPESPESQKSGLQFYLIRDSDTGVFLWALWIYKNIFFEGGCFSKYESLYMIAPVHSLWYLIRRKKVDKKWRIFLPLTNFFADYFFYRGLFLLTINFYRRIFLPIFFLQTKTFMILSLKSTLSLSIRL